MRIRRIVLFLWLLADMPLLTGCAGAQAEPPALPAGAEESARIVIASDLHYLAPSLTDHGPLFQAVAERGDGKLLPYVEEITEAFVEQMLQERPDAVILSGDLSFNGEYDSHLALTEKLRRLQAAGIQVLALSGNHDINCPYAARFEGESYERVKGTSAAEFRALYREFGYDKAIRADDYSGSYVYALRSDLWVLLLDTNSVIPNSFPEKSLDWLEEQLRAAQEVGARVLSVSHQNLLVHNPLFTGGYRITNAPALLSLMKRYGVIAQLSGHMHIQHYAEDGVPELLTSPLSLTPNRYGLLRYDGHSLRYEARSLDVSAWAARCGSQDGTLLDFAAYGERFFYDNSVRQILEAYAASGMSPETAGRLAALFADANLAYFTGRPVDREALSAGIAFWREQDEGFETAYLRSILQDEGEEALERVLWRENG